ncbi:hypothetical protein P7L54_13860 [Acinetobacter bereziniae]|uniref:hypothetical protein n=1 Tax=Acinetobacter bereziniae TaxID=106648 RepID=UPI0019046312|nr:hypothetical protein [Acinetobacter bereziniae]MDG3557032.1 hypothetical protein [Acinetobacter bereziniae]QQC81719.1 hypothetical protein I9192_06510 [Acinetobacter bereziniae]UUN94833.1 hypothetical protein I9189_006540 [Acinetobacter bereziniae]
MNINKEELVNSADTELLDSQIDQITNSFIEEHFLDNDEAEQLEMLVAKSMKLGELYERKKWQEKATPEGSVLMPIKPTETMVLAVAKEHEGDAFLPYSLYNAFVKQAMIEAQEQSHD